MGDVLRTIDGTDVTGWGPNALNSRLHGEEGSKVDVVIESAGLRRAVALDRARIDPFGPQ